MIVRNGAQWTTAIILSKCKSNFTEQQLSERDKRDRHELVVVVVAFADDKICEKCNGVMLCQLSWAVV